jgi:uncharacterized membrane protein
MRPLDELIAKPEQARVVAAIQATERRTSGEIRVHVEEHCPGGDAYRRAVELFEQLGLTRTRQRNGVLVYVAVADHRMAVLGDKGIHEDVGPDYWREVLEAMRAAFKQGALGDGLVAAVSSVGDRLAAKFPPNGDDENELPDEISG